MCDRWPPLPEPREDGSKSVSTAYGGRTFTKLQERIECGEISEAQIVLCYRMLVTECANPHACVEAVESGVLRVCISSLSSANSAIRLVAVQLLIRLLAAEAGRRDLASDKTWLETLGGMCEHDDDVTVRTAAALALQAYMSHSDGRTWLLVTAPSVIATMVRSLPVTPSSMHALATLAREEPRCVPALMAADAIKCVCYLLSHATDPAVVASSITLLKNMVHDDQSKLDALQHDALRSLQPYLEHADQNQLLHVLETIMLLSVPPEGKVAILDAKNAKVVSCCVDSLRSSDSRVAFVASNLIRSLCKSLPAQSIIIPRVVVHPDVFIRVFRETMCEPLLSLLESADLTVVSSTLVTLDALFSASTNPTELALTMSSMLHCRENLQCLATGCVPLATAGSCKLGAPMSVPDNDIKLAAAVLTRISNLL
jgi:hypothetical protein